MFLFLCVCTPALIFFLIYIVERLTQNGMRASLINLSLQVSIHVFLFLLASNQPTKPNQTKPNQTKPNQAKPSQTKPTNQPTNHMEQSLSWEANSHSVKKFPALYGT